MVIRRGILVKSKISRVTCRDDIDRSIRKGESETDSETDDADDSSDGEREKK